MISLQHCIQGFCLAPHHESSWLGWSELVEGWVNWLLSLYLDITCWDWTESHNQWCELLHVVVFWGAFWRTSNENQLKLMLKVHKKMSKIPQESNKYAEAADFGWHSTFNKHKGSISLLQGKHITRSAFGPVRHGSLLNYSASQRLHRRVRSRKLSDARKTPETP